MCITIIGNIEYTCSLKNVFIHFVKLTGFTNDKIIFTFFFRNTFKDCTSVQDLSLEANQISSLEDERTFSSMVSTLKTLDIGENLIAQFPDGIFSQHKELFGLRLAGNRLRNLTSLTFKGAENIRMLNLSLIHI